MALLFLLPPVVVGVVGAVLLALGGIPAGIVLLVIGCAFLVATVRLGSPSRLVARLGTRPATALHESRLVNLVDALCVASGLPVPELRMLDDPAANAIVLGRNAGDAVLIVTTGLVSVLDRLELEALLAHELAHVKQGDLRSATTTTRAFGLVAPLLSRTGELVRRAAGAQRESFADLAAVRLTRYPPALSSALEKLAHVASSRPSCLDAATARLTAALWCAPLSEATHGGVLVGALSLGERAAALREL